MEPRFTETHDKHGEPIFEGDTLRGKSIEGEILDFIVKWSDYRNSWLAENPGEIYDVAPSKFNEFEKINPA